MLVLRREVGQTIVIGPSTEPVVVQIVRLSGSKVRVGVTAPREVPVHRAEIPPGLALLEGRAEERTTCER